MARWEKRLALCLPDLTAALQARTFRSHIRADFSGGIRIGVNGTPTFYINGERHDAGFDFETLSAAPDSSQS
jgi:protein-disulfide isomerase